MAGTAPILTGFGFNGYRSFSDEGARLAPLGKVNMLAGVNNSGKSNILRFMEHFLKVAPTSPSIELDRPHSILPQSWEVTLDLFVADVALPVIHDRPRKQLAVRAVQVLTSAPSIATPFGLKFTYRLGSSDGPNRPAPGARAQWLYDPGDIRQMSEYLKSQGLSPMSAASALTQQDYFSGQDENFTLMALKAIAPNPAILPPVRIIQAFRQIRSETDGDFGQASDADLYNGVGLIRRLQRLESPKEVGEDRDELRAKYHRINAFVQHVLDDSSATLHIPYDASSVLVARNGSTLPLESLGTGVHQVVMLAAAATLLDRTMIGLEEPEVHLHPLLQRRLVRYLIDQTTNQYVIATHSAQLLDYERGSVFHVTYSGDRSAITPAVTPGEISKICVDLGYRPSDLLQTNAVIWVEGPSDRIYINYWMRLIDDTLIEGVHYSIMFYGGGLLRHLTPEDTAHPGLAYEYHEEDIEEFIRLRRLNRNLAIVIDSDKKSFRAKINATKTRVRDSFNAADGDGFAWVTDCYTIENYVPRDLLESAAKAAHPSFALLPDEGLWANPLRFKGGKTPDKVAIARAVTKEWGDRGLPNQKLARRVRELVSLIHRANGRD